jgi:hypothetical protein
VLVDVHRIRSVLACWWMSTVYGPCWRAAPYTVRVGVLVSRELDAIASGPGLDHRTPGGGQGAGSTTPASAIPEILPPDFSTSRDEAYLRGQSGTV